MPPRLLSDETVKGPEGDLGRSYDFVDTVHGVDRAGSVWTETGSVTSTASDMSLDRVTCEGAADPEHTTAAMPSLHFGYALMFGLTIMTIPLPPHRRVPVGRFRWFIRSLGIQMPSWRRLSSRGILLSIRDFRCHHCDCEPFCSRWGCGGAGMYFGMGIQLCPTELAASRRLSSLGCPYPQTGANGHGLRFW